MYVVSRVWNRCSRTVNKWYNQGQIYSSHGATRGMRFHFNREHVLRQEETNGLEQREREVKIGEEPFFNNMSSSSTMKPNLEEMMEKIKKRTQNTDIEHEFYRGRPPISLPHWLEEMKSNKSLLKELKEQYDVQFYPIEQCKIIQFPNIKLANSSMKEEQESFKEEGIMWHINHLLSETDYVKMSGGRKEYCLVGESFYFPDFRDFPVNFTPTHRSYLWIDLNASQPKLMIQISVATPPILWIPIKPSLEALGRVMEEFLTVESVSASRHLTDFEDSLQAIGFDSEKLAKGELTYEKIRDKLLERLKNDVDPFSRKFKELHNHEYENEVCLFMGNVADAKDMEISMMNNPFVFNTPVLLGSSNRFVANNPVVRSIFRTVYSRSVISIEVRCDLFMELGDGGRGASDTMLPVFARIQYPSNKRMSKPGPERMNRLYNTCYPEDMPVDVIAACFGNSMRDYNYFLKEIQYLQQNAITDIPIQLLAYLAILKYPKWEEEIFNIYSTHREPMVRMACVKGAGELGLKERLQEMRKVEKKSDIQTAIDKTLEKIEAEEKQKLEEEQEAISEKETQRQVVTRRLQEMDYQRKLQESLKD